MRVSRNISHCEIMNASILVTIIGQGWNVFCLLVEQSRISHVQWVTTKTPNLRQEKVLKYIVVFLGYFWLLFKNTISLKTPLCVIFGRNFKMSKNNANEGKKSFCWRKSEAQEACTNENI